MSVKPSLTRPKDYKRIDAENPVDSPIFKENFNSMIDDLNRRVKEFPVTQLSGQILEVTIAAGDSLRVSHSLKIIPKYRLVLGQVGVGELTDVKGKDANQVSYWTDKYVTLKNNGAVSVTYTVILIKE